MEAYYKNNYQNPFVYSAGILYIHSAKNISIAPKMTVAHTDYLKSHLAAKQEAQLKKVEQSAHKFTTHCTL